MNHIKTMIQQPSFENFRFDASCYLTETNYCGTPEGFKQYLIDLYGAVVTTDKAHQAVIELLKEQADSELDGTSDPIHY